jgi:23S rRNA pseudouridine1911/1915/1917 synthase
MEHVYEFLVTEAEARTRLDVFLSRRLPFLSYRQIRQLCHSGAAQVDGVRHLRGYALPARAQVRVSQVPAADELLQPEPLPLAIIYEDDSLLVVNKPAGMLVHTTPGVRSGTVLNGLAHYLNQGREPADWLRPRLAHRLDRDTSGLLVAVKTLRAMRVMMNHFASRKVKKLYLALVHGVVAADELLIDAPIGRDETQQPFWRICAGGREAQTRLRVLQRLPDHTLVELEPLTGRTHQLRIHCTHSGHPIVGDTLHGPLRWPATRLCLHAAYLGFHHPVTGVWLSLSDCGLRHTAPPGSEAGG